MFSARRAAQMSAFFAKKEGGRINILKLIKLLYLSDREALTRHGFPISYDKYVSMDNGPVLSKTLDLINGFVEGSQSADWENWITNRECHDISVKRNFSRDDLDDLSNADIEVLGIIWDSFGRMNQWQLVEYTHTHCPEWQDPKGAAIEIEESSILQNLGKTQVEISFIKEEIEAQRNLSNILLAI